MNLQHWISNQTQFCLCDYINQLSQKQLKRQQCFTASSNKNTSNKNYNIIEHLQHVLHQGDLYPLKVHLIYNVFY